MEKKDLEVEIRELKHKNEGLKHELELANSQFNSYQLKSKNIKDGLEK